MKQRYRWGIGIMIVALLSASPAFAEREEFLTENLLSDLDNELELDDQELAELKPAVEKKSKELRALIDKKVDEGFLELESLSRELNQKIRGLEQELDTFLSDLQIQELKEYLATLDDEAIKTMIDEIIARLATRLELKSEKLAQFETILRDELNKQAELLSRFLDRGAQAFDEFQQENNQLWQDIGKRLEEILSSEQMQEARKWKQEVEEKIRKLFQEKQ